MILAKTQSHSEQCSPAVFRLPLRKRDGVSLPHHFKYNKSQNLKCTCGAESFSTLTSMQLLRGYSRYFELSTTGL